MPFSAFLLRILCALVISAAALPAWAEQCSNAVDMDAASRASIERAALQYFDYVSRTDAASLKQNSIALVASNFGGVEALINDMKPVLSGAQANVRATYLLEADGTAPLEHAEFLCGIWGTAQFVSFQIPNLPPGRYGLVIEDVKTGKGPYFVSFVLQQDPNNGPWKLAGFPPPKPAEVLGHDAPWYLVKAREFKAKGEQHNAWFYYQQARSLAAPVNFIVTTPLVKLDKEAQQVLPSDLPLNGPVNFAAPDGKTYQLKEVFPVLEENGMDLVVKYALPDISNTAQTFQDNMSVIKAMVSKYPEYRETFTGIVARAVDPNGKDYGTLLAMKDIK